MAKYGILILKLIKKIILAFCFIYGFDFIVAGMNIFIPINLITLSVVTILGLPGLLALLGVYFVI